MLKSGAVVASPSTPQNLKNNNNNERKSSGKKLKQTRLPFPVLSSADKTHKPNDKEARKRKPSASPEEVRRTKIGRSEIPAGGIKQDDHKEEEQQCQDISKDVMNIIDISDSDEIADHSKREGEEETEARCSSEALEETAKDTVEVMVVEPDLLYSEANSLTGSDISRELERLAEETDDPVDKTTSESVSDDKSTAIGDEELVPPVNANGKPLTPRQLEKFQEKKRKYEERMQQKLDREKRLEEERLQKEERERQRKLEREQKEEQKRKEKEDKEALRQREKEERDRKRQQELDVKNEERRKREEEKMKLQQEEEAKKKKAAQAFTKFFKVGTPKAAAAIQDTTVAINKPEALTVSSKDEPINQAFMPFALKGAMKLAPQVRRQLSDQEKRQLELVLAQRDVVDVQQLYLKSFKSKCHVPLKSSKTWTVESDSDDELMVVGEEGVAHKVEALKPKAKYRAKYLSFKENRRPAYYGTWQKQSKVLGPRKPFQKDEKFFDYEVDSDEEWEEEEPGESLHGSDDEKDKESEDDYEVDNEFFVPHGHLSEEEMQDAEEDITANDNTPEMQKLKQKLMQSEFNDEMKKKTEKIKPRVIGCIWTEERGKKAPANCPAVFWEILQARAILFSGPIMLQPPVAEVDDDEEMADNEEAADDQRRKKINLPEDEIRDLIKLVHGNLNQAKFLVKEYQEFRKKRLEESAGAESLGVVTNMSIMRRIRELAKWETCRTGDTEMMHNRSAWIVQPDALERYGMAHWPLLNQWQYTLTPKRTHESLRAPATDKKDKISNPPAVAMSVPQSVGPCSAIGSAASTLTPPTVKAPSHTSIAKFAKVLTSAERLKSIAPKSSVHDENANGTIEEATVSSPQSATSNPVLKKRVALLMSVPRGQNIPEQSKNQLIKKFLKNKPATESTDETKTADSRASSTGVAPVCIVVD